MEAELRRAVFEHPDDDAPRYVYADWLMERGDAYGRFISAQLRGQTSLAMAVFGDIVLRASAGVAVNPQLGHFKRGFLTELSLSADATAEADVWPLVEQLRMLGAEKDAALVRAVGRWPRLESLSSDRGAAVSAMAATGRGPLKALQIGELIQAVDFGSLVGPETSVTVRFLRQAMSLRRDASGFAVSVWERSLVPRQLLASVLSTLVRPQQPVSLSVRLGCESEAVMVRSELELAGAGPVTELRLLTIG